ncbi:hypothetical protein FA15DRAFT_581429, partial [Coprinopsis marcescibilis]
VRGQTSLYIPGFEPVPVSADIVGIDEQGRTTWRLQKGASTPGITPRVDFIGTATLVEEDRGVSFTYSNSEAGFAIGQQCTFSDDFAVCTIIAQGSTATQTEIVSRVEVQGGRTLTSTSSEGGLSSSSSAYGSPLPTSLPGTNPQVVPTSNVPSSTSSALGDGSTSLWLLVSLFPVFYLVQSLSWPFRGVC